MLFIYAPSVKKEWLMKRLKKSYINNVKREFKRIHEPVDPNPPPPRRVLSSLSTSRILKGDKSGIQICNNREYLIIREPVGLVLSNAPFKFPR